MLYTIGHSNRSIDSFLSLLHRYDINYIADIRTSPYSAYNPEFNRPELKQALNKQGFKYVYMGDTLGGRPADPACYNLLGKVDYSLVRRQPFFRQGIDRLLTAWEKDVQLALLCSEAKPQNCHRSRLVGKTLEEMGVYLRHIDENGFIRHQTELFEPKPATLFR